MKTRMKLLDLRLLMILAGFATPVVATSQIRAEGTAYPDSVLGCEGSVVCAADGGEMLFNVKRQPTKAIGDKIISLPNNGMIWLTENPNMGSAELSVSAPSYVPFYNGQITKPVEFHVRSNYSAFVSKYEILLFRGNDVDLVAPIAVIPVDVKAITSVNWNGELPSNYQFRLNDNIRYIVRAYDNEGHFDETYSKEIRLVTPEEDERGNVEIRDSISRLEGQFLSQDEALTESLIDDVVGSNDLYRQNIPFVGARVRIQGSNVPEGSVYINGESYPVDRDRKFEADFLVPLGQQQFDVEVANTNGRKINRTLETDITGDSFFMVGIADVTLYQRNVSGPGQDAIKVDADGNPQSSDILADGRLAFYLKSRLKGRYTITAHADTKEKEIKHLFSGFGRAYPEDVFRALDPDLYYPTYGDDSSVYRDVDTMGRFYARVDWDKNQALWGNYNTGITGTEFGTYSRSLYGGAVDLRTNANTIYGDTKGTLRVFGSQAQSMPGHSEFLGTGGSLYYLRHTRVLPGSDKVQVKVIDPTTGLTQALISLERGVDYEFDATQGRLILSRPLLQIVGQYNPSIISEGPLRGYEQYLLVDYEYVPTGFDPKDITRGGRGQYWLNDHLAVGVTYVDERQGGQSSYELQGFDTILKAGNGTYLRAEYTHTRNQGVPSYLSNDGGLSFNQVGELSADGPNKGEAYAVEGRVNLREQGVTERDVQTGAWYKKTKKGFSNGYSSNLGGVEEYGAEVSAEITDNLIAYIRHSVAKRESTGSASDNEYTQSQISLEQRFENNSTLTGEVKQVTTKVGEEKATGRLAAVRYSWFATPNLELYTTGQLTIDDDNKKYEKNNSVTAGFRYFYGDNSSVNLEGTTGTRGHSILAGVEHKLSSDHTVYANYTFANSKSDYDSVFDNNQNGLTVGQRWRLTDRLNIFNEVQSLKSGNERGIANTIGADYTLGDGWSTNVTFQQSRLKRQMIEDADDITKRNAVSASISKTNEIIELSSKLEYRRDKGSETTRKQWLTTNRISYKFDDSLRFQGKFNYSKSYDTLDSSKDTRFIDSAIGFAYRPWDNNKWAVFGRYNYFVNDANVAQVGSGSGYDTNYYGMDYDQKSHIFSLEGVYKHNAEWEFGAKVAYRKGETRYHYLNNTWFDSSALFAAAQVRYDLVKKWHVLAEYRMLKVKDGGTKSGFLIGIDKDITENFRIGFGYNFTDFSDDLTRQDYRFKGFYLNFVGYY
ncbi:hypothetical protein WMO13_07035 [Ignatzschineria larvae DSM 13226]|uniref:Outer membrane protein beta-barrel domain-containing protein n=1 Tax=Ignatzschineria larvae DSM 13226 TaxID=1111732 RepID=A0ABZ3C2A5_9GAMM|nr:hypothetical protein [Ignatzschineria larvae]